MSAVGIDLGSEGLVVAVIRRGGVEVLQNEVGKRITPNMVAFSGKQRLMGDQATAQFMSNPKNSIKYSRRLLGLRTDDPDLKLEKPFLTYKTVARNKDGDVGIEVNYDDNTTVFSPEQIVGTLLTRAKAIAEGGLGTKVLDCVIGIPAYWNDRHRRALLDAAAIAGLNVLRLMHEPTAIALTYGILRPLPEKETRYVLFVDLGISSYHVSLVSFSGGKELKVIASEQDPHFGGRNIDQMLANHFAKLIKQKYGLDVLSEAKPTLKLYKECDRVKTVLSANSMAEFHVEYIMNDRDVSATIERTEFEAMVVAAFFDRLITPIKKVFESPAVKELKITKETIHSVEIVGGGVRIPIIQKTLKDYLGKDLGKTCDGDESVARGCALQCAMLSPVFKVKDFGVHDIYPFAIDVSWGPAPSKGQDAMEIETGKPTTLFSRNNPLPSVKSLTFADRTEPFQIVAKYTDPSPTADSFIGRWVVGGIPTPTNPSPKIKVFVKLNLSGICSVSSAQHLEDYWVEEPEEEPKKEEPKKEEPKKEEPKKEEPKKEEPKKEEPKKEEPKKEEPKKEEPKDDSDKGKDSKKGDKGKAKGKKVPKKEGKKEGKKKQKKSQGEEPKPMDTDSTPKPEEQPKADDKDKAAAPEATPAPVKMKKKKKTKRVDLKVEVHQVSSLSVREIKDLTEKEVQMAFQDRLIEETAEARNSLESFVLDTRSKVQDDNELAPYIKDPAELKRILDKLQETEDWWDSDGFDAQKSAYIAKLEEVMKVTDPVYKRRLDHIKEIEAQKAKEIEAQKAKEAEAKAKEAEAANAKEAEAAKAKEAEAAGTEAPKTS